MNEFKRFSAESNKSELPLTSDDFRIWLAENMGDKIKRREYDGIEEYHLENNVIVTIKIGLVAEAFGEKSTSEKIRVQVEDGANSYETTWDELRSDLKNSVIEQIK